MRGITHGSDWMTKYTCHVMIWNAIFHRKFNSDNVRCWAQWKPKININYSNENLLTWKKTVETYIVFVIVEITFNRISHNKKNSFGIDQRKCYETYFFLKYLWERKPSKRNVREVKKALSHKPIKIKIEVKTRAAKWQIIFVYTYKQLPKLIYRNDNKIFRYDQVRIFTPLK